MSEVSKNGDFIYFPINISNAGPNANTGVTVQDVLAPGLIRQSYTFGTPAKGTYNISTGLWTVGTHNVGQSYLLTVKYKVVDISLATEESGVFGFALSATISGDNIDPNDINNTITDFVAITTCPPSAGAVNDENACLCGSVAENDTECSQGTTEYRLTLGSLINLDGAFELDVETGNYNAMGMILNPFEPASFTYSIWCIIGEDEYQTSGPATVEIPALLSATNTDSMVDNGDGTMTHTALDGTVTIFNRGWTTVAEDSGTGDLTFTYPDGTTVVINLGSITNPGFTVYPSTISASIALIPSTLRNFTKVDDSGGAVINIGLPDPALLGLDANRTEMWTFKRIVIDSGGTISLTPDAFKTIDGQASYVFPANDYSSVTLWTDGVNYFAA